MLGSSFLIEIRLKKTLTLYRDPCIIIPININMSGQSHICENDMRGVSHLNPFEI